MFFFFQLDKFKLIEASDGLELFDRVEVDTTDWLILFSFSLKQMFFFGLKLAFSSVSSSKHVSLAKSSRKSTGLFGFVGGKGGLGGRLTGFEWPCLDFVLDGPSTILFRSFFELSFGCFVPLLIAEQLWFGLGGLEGRGGGGRLGGAGRGGGGGDGGDAFFLT